MRLLFIILTLFSISVQAQRRMPLINGNRFTAVDLTTNLSLNYTFEDGTGSTVTDQSTSGNNGTIIGTPKWRTGKIGTWSLSFEQDVDKVTLANNANLSPGTSDFTISLWIYTYPEGNGTEQWVYSDYGSNDNNLVLLRIQADGKLNGYIRDGAGNAINIVTAGSLTNATWYHIALVKAGTAASIYVNNVVDASGSNSSLGNILTSDGPVPTIGLHPIANTTPLQGKIDGFRFYKGTAPSVSALYNGGAGL